MSLPGMVRSAPDIRWRYRNYVRPAEAPDLTRAYLDLLKKTLTDTIYGVEPDPDSAAYVRDFLQHYVRGRAHTMVPRMRLDNVQRCLEEIHRTGVKGDLLEAGVWRGGVSIFMKGLLRAYQIDDRRVWVADSFRGLPEPDAQRFPIEARAHRSQTMVEDYKHFAADLATVRDNFSRYDLLDDGVVFLEGWFKDTLPPAPISELALLRADCDYYESTMDVLKNLYPKVSVGGYVIIDDYGEDRWTYCRKAVDDFRREHGITDPMVQVDTMCHYWKRSR
jgi:hypothetical protein